MSFIDPHPPLDVTFGMWLPSGSVIALGAMRPVDRRIYKASWTLRGLSYITTMLRCQCRLFFDDLAKCGKYEA